MKVKIKKHPYNGAIKNNGMELGVSDNDEKHIGDLVITKTGLTWCEGRTTPKNGSKLSWDDFRQLLNNR